MKKLRWGVIGAGGIADRRTIPGMMLAKNAELIAVMDIHAEQVEKIRQKYGAKRGYTKEEDLLADPEVDAVYIATPIVLHAKQAKLAADYGKDILIEKPLAMTSDEGQAVIDYCERKGVKIAAGFMMRFGSHVMSMKKAIAEGKILHETDIEKMLQKRRAEMPGYFEDSFSTIAAYGTNAAMMHYHAEGDVNSVIEPHGFLLVDNGGQYDCGTTDITRTYPVGPLTDNERRYYTWVLQSHIDMARAVFLDYCTGFALDTFARGPVWAHKVNYRCGTGHGVGFISGVHEGPQSLRPNNPVIFKPGMTITDEPGIYETDEVGIRIENELECIDLGENQYGHWLGFAPLTLVPISTEPVLVDELSRDQINWLNDYHAHVYEMLSPRLNEDEKVWLKEKCAAIGR